MTRRGWGAIEARRSKVNPAKVTSYRAQYVGADGRTYRRTFTSHEAAEGWLRDEERLIVLGAWTAPEMREGAKQAAAVRAQTVAEYSAARLAALARTLKPRTVEEYRRYHARFVQGSALGGLPLQAVTVTDATAWYGWLRAQVADSGRGDGSALASNVYVYVRSLFNQAVKERLIGHNPVDMKGAQVKRRQSAKTSASPADVAALAARMPDHMRVLVLVAAWGGLRGGEVRALRRRDVDLTARAVTIRAQVQQQRGRGVVFETVKTTAGQDRVVHLPAPVMTALTEHLSVYAQPGRDGLVFPNTAGQPIDYTSFWEAFDRARREIGRPDLRGHDLRSTGATLFAQQGATIADMMGRFGWTTPRMAAVYVTAAEERDRQLADAMNDLVVIPAA